MRDSVAPDDADEVLLDLVLSDTVGQRLEEEEANDEAELDFVLAPSEGVENSEIDALGQGLLEPEEDEKKEKESQRTEGEPVPDEVEDKLCEEQ